MSVNIGEWPPVVSEELGVNVVPITLLALRGRAAQVDTDAPVALVRCLCGHETPAVGGGGYPCPRCHRLHQLLLSVVTSEVAGACAVCEEPLYEAGRLYCSPTHRRTAKRRRRLTRAELEPLP